MSGAAVRTTSDGSMAEQRRLKRDKIRKGTFSCWECKRRKKRCTISASSVICNGCIRLGTRCIGQEYDDENDQALSAIQGRLENVERLAVSVAKHREHLGQQTLQQRPRSTASCLVNPLTGAGEDRISRCRSLSGYFHSVLPHPFIASLIASQGKSAYEGMSEPTKLSKTSNYEPPLSSLTVDVQTALLARTLIRLAVSLMYVDATFPERAEDLQLDASAMETAHRYVGAAQHLTCQTELLQSTAGLECVMMQAHWNIHLGRIGEAGALFRQALHLAWCLDLPAKATVDDGEGSTARLSCLRLLSASRGVSLYSGGPCDEIDERTLRCDQEVLASPCERLDRLHVRMWRLIIARNLRIQRQWHCWPQREAVLQAEMAETLNVDLEMKQTVLSVPSVWWQLPSASQDVPDSAESEPAFSRLTTSKDHYYTIVLAHLPYVLQASTSNLPTPFTYNRAAAISASREVLLRFPIYTQFRHVPASYRALEHKAFIVGVVLLLAHMQSHQTYQMDAIEHERPKDLNALLGAINSMEKVFDRDRQNPGSECASTLRTLMLMEQDMADGVAYHISCFAVDSSPARELAREGVLDIRIPYFGILRIEKEASSDAFGPFLAGASSSVLSMDCSIGGF